jgi:hypothetical protein
MDITEALEAALAEVKAAIPGAQAEAEKAARHVAELLDEERGLQLALARRTAPAAVSTTNTTSTVRTVGIDAVLVGPPAEPATPEVEAAESDGDWASLNHMDAVLRALTEAKRPLSPQDIVRALRAVGRLDSNEQVRAALAALKRRDRVALPARAQWVATVQPSNGTRGDFTVALSRVNEGQSYHPAPFDLRRSESNGLASIPADAREQEHGEEVRR